MSVKGLFDQTSLPHLEQVMDQSALRQRAYASNLANVSTLGYKRLDVRFAQEMERSSQKLELSKTEADHSSGVSQENNFAVQETPGADGDYSVDVDREMVAIAENQLRFNLAARLAALRIAGIRASIRGGR